MIRTRFDSFILLAEMRTGSNFLEENLNRIPGLRCWGEAFNPAFAGHAGRTALAGVTLDAREADPHRLLHAIRAGTDGMAGFRFFHDHDPRILEACLADRRCAKIVLARNPLDSFLSLQIARRTGQWRLGDLKTARSARVRFDAEAFRDHLDTVEGFRQTVRRALQVSGQAAFHLDYDDVGDIELVNGLAAFLGVPGRIDALSTRTRVQNPTAPEDRVENPDEMRAALTNLDRFGIDRVSSFEPQRGANVPAHVSASRAGLSYMPIRIGVEAEIEAWLAALEGVAPAALERGRTQKAVRRWKRERPGHRSFTVIRHPVDRAHAAFCDRILLPGPACHTAIRAVLRDRYDMPLPEGAPDAGYDRARHRAAFLGFLAFVRGNLGGQTGLRTEADWATQASLVQGLGNFAPPDHILRHEELADRLPALAAECGLASPAFVRGRDAAPFAIEDICDAEVEAAVRAAYRRDYVLFGFPPRGG